MTTDILEPAAATQPAPVPLSEPVKRIVSNPLKTREDAVELLEALLAPLAAAQSKDGARIRLEAGGVWFDSIAADLEGYARALWGLAPALAAEPDHPRLRALGDKWARGLDVGTDPNHAEFWGWPIAPDQRFVEMAAIGVAIQLVPQVFWEPQTEAAKARIAKWLLTINDNMIPENNWRFFRVLVNVGLKSVGAPYSEQHIEDTLEFIESFYGEHGLPADGKDGVCDAYDYYATSFAIPFYSLMYTRLHPGDKRRGAKFWARARQNAPLAVHLFAPTGEAIPFGRSLTYRFACVAFYSALAWASDTDPAGQNPPPAPFSWGVLKGLVLRHIRWFTQQPSAFHRDGSMSIGWAYPQLLMSEQYNSPQSPYWALKSFLVLALPKDHPFWTAKEEPIPSEFASGAVVKPWRQVFSHAAGHTFLLTQGQNTNWPMRQTAPKYGKMAYSAQFGFSVPGSAIGLGAAAPDSTLALTDDNEYWKVPRIVESHDVSDEGVITSVWKPWSDVTVKTWLVPPQGDSAYHTRVHKITSSRKLRFASSGFCLSNQTGPEGNQRWIPEVTSDAELETSHGRFESSSSALMRSPSGVGGVFDMLDTDNRARIKQVDPSTNLIFPRSMFPMLVGEAEGEKWVALRIFATPRAEGWAEEWKSLKPWGSLEEMRKEIPFVQ